MKVLVTAASRHEGTTGIAEAIAGGLRRRGIEAVTAAPEDVLGLVGYDAVVLGSAVYAGRWLEPARRFAERFSGALRLRSVWLFSSGPLGTTDPRPHAEPVDVAGMIEATGARGHRVLPGRLERRRLGTAERAVVRLLRAPAGDFRDWDAVDDFAGAIAAELLAGAALR